MNTNNSDCIVIGSITEENGKLHMDEWMKPVWFVAQETNGKFSFLFLNFK